MAEAGILDFIRRLAHCARAKLEVWAAADQNQRNEALLKKLRAELGDLQKQTAALQLQLERQTKRLNHAVSESTASSMPQQARLH